jgi:glycosyltransferase involved in cell wall biosynthesis
MIRSARSDFALTVTGHCAGIVSAEPNVDVVSFVENLDTLYRTAPFTICPILGKTGQQVKILESMARGVPVVATEHAAEGSPIEHGVNGFVAATPDDFAEYVLKLWSDRDLCARLGSHAIRTIRERHSPRLLAERLSTLLTDDSVVQPPRE